MAFPTQTAHVVFPRGPLSRRHSQSNSADGSSSGNPPAVAVGRPRALVVGTDDWAVDRAVATLEDASFTVLRCHDPGEPAFPCNALREGRSCPLDIGVDVVATMRARPLRSAAEGEFGIICAQRVGVPLVVAGLSPEALKPWASAVVDYEGDLGTVCAKVVAERADLVARPAHRAQRGSV